MVKIDIAGKDGEIIVCGESNLVMEQLSQGVALAVEMIQADQPEGVSKEVVLAELVRLVRNEIGSLRT